MARCRPPLVLFSTLLGLWFFAGGSSARPAPSCDGSSAGTILLLILPSAERVHAYAETLRHIPVVRRDAATVIFRDGRVVTADIAATTRHLNELGWGNRPLEVVASFPLRPRRRSFG